MHGWSFRRLVTGLRQWVPKLKEGGFAEVVFEDALEMLIDQLNSLGSQDSLTVQSLVNNMQDQMVSYIDQHLSMKLHAFCRSLKQQPSVS